MFRKYEKTPRIRVPQYPEVRGKRYLSDAEVSDLFSGRVIVTEKMDGANTGLIQSNQGVRLQKRGSLVDYSEHEQFNRFKAWSMERHQDLQKIPRNHIVYGELMFCVHSITYDKLPDWFLVFAVWDKREARYVEPDRVAEICHETNLKQVPELYRGHSDKGSVSMDMPKISAYGSEPAEGIVVWNWKKQIRGKVVKPEFLKRLGDVDHWSKGPIRFNKLGA